MVSKKQKIRRDVESYQNKILRWYYFIPLLFIIVIIPLIVRGKYIELDNIQSLFWKGNSYHFDIYSFWKANFLIVLTLLSLFLYACLCR